MPWFESQVEASPAEPNAQHGPPPLSIQPNPTQVHNKGHIWARAGRSTHGSRLVAAKGQARSLSGRAVVPLFPKFELVLSNLVLGVCAVCSIVIIAPAQGQSMRWMIEVA